jgi:hypothetical protein
MMPMSPIIRELSVGVFAFDAFADPAEVAHVRFDSA